jgi:hypothetical protein
MKQTARNVTLERCGALGDSRYLLHDHDAKYTASFLAIIESAHVKTLQPVLLFPHAMETRCGGAMGCRERLGGLPRYYQRDAA